MTERDGGESTAILRQREAAQRILARRKLIHYTQYTYPQYEAGWVHHAIAARLDQFLADVKAKRSPRLMLQMPPRRGKTELAALRFGAFSYSTFPGLEIISATYGQTLSRDNSLRLKRILRSDGHKALFPNVHLPSATEKQRHGLIDTQDEWQLPPIHTNAQISKFTATSHTGSVTGKGAHIIILDDLIRGIEDADSETIRESVFKWYKADIRTRLYTGGGILVIGTRWNEDDLQGRLIAEMEQEDGEPWIICRYPEIAEEPEDYELAEHPYLARLPEDVENREIGECLHPERYPMDEVQRIKGGLGVRLFEGLFQQRPKARGGGLFPREYANIITAKELPPFAELQRVRYWDRAATSAAKAAKAKGGHAYSWTAGVLLAYHRKSKRWYVLDVRRFQQSPKDVRESIKAVASQDGSGVKIRIEQEGGSTGIESMELIIDELKGYDAKGDKPTGSKLTRAEATAAQWALRNFYLVKAAWNEPYLNELDGAGAGGKTMDQVDATSGAFMAIAGTGYSILDFAQI